MALCFSHLESGLYFEFLGERYDSGDTIYISDIGISNFGTALLGPGSSLACVTSEVNSQCCRGSDGGNVGEWYFPDGTIVPRNRQSPGGDFTRSGYTEQVRLNRRNDAMGPTGTYTCRVPDGENSGLIHEATIRLGIKILLFGSNRVDNFYHTSQSA